MPTPQPPLRILIIVNLPWDPRLGASRVWMELAEQWRARGHIVEKFSLSDAFSPQDGWRGNFALRQLLFVRKAAVYVRQHGSRFDVIDALIGTLPFSKGDLQFDGIIVARSVGLYLLYERFEQSVAERWPRPPSQGKLLGRLLYGFTRRRLLQDSGRAVRTADLVNVPNEEEAQCLHDVLGSQKEIIVVPYGLTTARHATLRKAALPPEVRLAEKRICFIGMWSARKGAYDWGRIIAAVQRHVPDARFRFLGTTVAPEVVRADLRLTAPADIELISHYEPDELPGLVADCTAGAFPSYVEGFGLAVLEQLAAALPTVAYDAAGPRSIVGDRLREMLVPAGDIEGFALAVTRVLQMDAATYAALAEQSSTRAAEFSWDAVAEETIDAYRAAQTASESRTLMFVQPFTLRSPGGGARILRALLEESPCHSIVVCTSPDAACEGGADELHVPLRPFFGRIERTRFAGWPEKLTPLWRPLFRRRLRAACRARNAIAVHAIPHASLDFYDSYCVARELGLAFFLQVHDDLLFSIRGRVDEARAEEALREVWMGSDLRFVVSQQLGREYCRRYGAADFITVTDGIAAITPRTRTQIGATMRVYFMGLFHLEYEENLRVLLAAIARAREVDPRVEFSVTMRCGQVRQQVAHGADHVRVLPFGSEGDVEADLEHADLLYLPLPFGTEFAPFTRLSLSTKVVTYLGSGVPILYHGPADAAVCDLLREHDAALLHTDLVPESLASTLTRLLAEPESAAQLSRNALQLAEEQFLLDDQRRKFWDAVTPFCESSTRKTGSSAIVLSTT